ncbi:hypothetical protein PQC07_gp193 [Aeromonas phage D3]|uniref:Uncharacterized protein n=3 Tax=Ludhianavirus TaxID=3044751 RepID=A0A514A1H3_9CAUD|nr:hypothetical protein PQC06_gp013 [Aeromonas phage LAh10]YP_010668563.1 hypothetical protein PQC07_gp193 [Aeromonas phage D3]YP_010668829.1 hypothetical protein PQC08_gp194 [Aeromonas phage D6]QEP52386.1 hypothetical protein D9_0179 [Aeromonas phage D9]QDH47128.1 hypothetical protein LAh10_13 [Aeromonas phage LAh10]QDJ97080.1 hypothetical protein D3_0082 [Aeromonas phage D3]QDJ97241.1 hypothetical protein D6_0081 [Aeromonas phage D6]
MVIKEEIRKTAEEIIAGQQQLNRYNEYYETFLSEARCKKGIMDFLSTLFDKETTDEFVQYPYGRAREEMVLKLTTGKSAANSMLCRRLIMDVGVESRGFQALEEARKTLLNQVADYIVQTFEKLNKSELTDVHERHVYLRRAIAKLVRLFYTAPLAAITMDQWSEVEPSEHTKYLTTTIEEMVDRIRPTRTDGWCSVWFAENGLDNTNVIRSIISYLDYLDTFDQY